MKQYIEAYEQTPLDIALDWARIEIEGDADVSGAILQIDAIMADSKPYRVIRHYCRHDERKSCQTIEIKVVA